MKAADSFESWGRNPKAEQSAFHLFWMETPPSDSIPGYLLPRGKGRSYGDVCLNDHGTLLVTERMDHFLAFDAHSGVLRCEAGVTLGQILEVSVPHGWFLPVTPGTKIVTVAGAVANDVHGKNHHRYGTFGEHVRAFELVRSDGSRSHCTPSQNQDLFRATIGGLGLTGLMLWVEIQLKRIATPFVWVEKIKCRNLNEFFQLSVESESTYEYTVSWVDCLSSGPNLGRGIFMRGNDATLEQAGHLPSPKGRKTISIGFDAPNFLLNRLTVLAFNTLYRSMQPRSPESRLTHYEPFFYPLDAVDGWNRLYGKRGFYQYQFLVPLQHAATAVADILKEVSRSGAASFLSVMKTLGNRPAAGIMSFPREGLTLTMDFPNSGDKTLRLMDELDKIVLQTGGAVYPAKDARMAPETFRRFFPQWKEFASWVDPRFSSSFWRRVTR